ncbi:MAG: RsmB/NOP family class I SAM-dependent RNA methyltransferase [Saprospiraceae bacterium]
MKLHKILADAVLQSLYTIFSENRYADKVIEKTLKSNKKWGSRDRGFIAESIYDIVRNWRLLGFVCEVEGEELQHLWKVFGAWYFLKYKEIPNWSEFDGLDENKITERHILAADHRATFYSIPDWMDTRCNEEFGDKWPDELKALNEPAEVFIRVNTHKTNCADLKSLLEKEGILVSLVPDSPDALKLQVRKNLFSSPLFLNGYFEIQDAGSQWIARFLDPQPGNRVIDACAGAGGKTLHLSALMENKGHLIAMDIEEWKLSELKKRAKRGAAHNIETRLIESNKTIKRLHETADRLLLDVPCSGLGVLRRNPDAKWKIQADFIDKVCLTQQEILKNYSKMLRKGGQMVYATCSILPSENENQVKWFLELQKGAFQLLEEKHCLPSKNGYDGFYMALLKRVK